MRFLCAASGLLHAERNWLPSDSARHAVELVSSYSVDVSLHGMLEKRCALEEARSTAVRSSKLHRSVHSKPVSLVESFTCSSNMQSMP